MASVATRASLPAGLILRGLCADDAESLHALALRPEIERWSMDAPGMTLDARRARLESLAMNQHAIGAWAGATLVGWTELTQGKYRRAHAAVLALTVHDAWRRRGIGRALMRETLDLADNWLGLRRIEVNVYADDRPGLAFHRGFGFDVEALKRGIALRDGVLADACLMARLKDPMPLAAD
ncbi:GNAT family N-acetyltransferase [Burkholderia alba]|uniref:GNAT family N-acetyltransferase n=1 Tax=Burkholderia alba TaxID=2683677 RepID=UPI002B0578F6|nr:GNAT family N-acetyltransferase [Burkholderia alba]